jgi:hypothetical protein
MWRRSLASTLILACAVGLLTTGCVVAAGDDDGWRHDRGRYRHDNRWDPRWDYRQREHRW